MRWIEESKSCSSIFLIQGHRGVGKTALVQSIAERLQRENRKSYACFFFKQGMVGCDNLKQLFSTLAYQLAINTTDLREHIGQAMIEDPALPKKCPATQLQRLIIDPFKFLLTSHPSPILIIDGLNECEEEKSQDLCLALISQLLTDPTVTIRVIISGLSDRQYEHMRRTGLDLGWLDLDRPHGHVRTPCMVAIYGIIGTAFFFFPPMIRRHSPQPCIAPSRA